MKIRLALVVLALALTVGLSKASGEPVQSGLSVIGYSINQIPPVRSDSSYPKCGEGQYDIINQSWDQQPFAQCGWDRFMLHYRGFIQIPDGVQTVRFAVSADDGSDITVGSSYHFGSWRDKSCSTDYSQRITLPTSTPLPIDAWFYENGGGTCFRLYWQFDGDNQNWVIVPASAFTTAVATTTTETTTTTTTTTEPPTTIPQTTTSSTTSTTELPPIQTSLPPLPAVVVIPTTTELSTTTEPAQTTTSSPPQTTSPTTTDSPSSHTTTSVATTVPPTTTTRVVTPSTTTTTVAPTTTPPTTFTTTTTLPAVPVSIPADQAVAIATSAEAVATLTPEQASVVFASVDERSLTNEQATQLVAAVQHAPAKIRKAFEKKVAVFGGKFENYIPLNSRVPVRTRRIIIIGTVVIAAITTRKRKQ